MPPGELTGGRIEKGRVRDERIRTPDPHRENGGEDEPSVSAIVDRVSVGCQWLFPAHNREWDRHTQLANGVRKEK